MYFSKLSQFPELVLYKLNCFALICFDNCDKHIIVLFIEFGEGSQVFHLPLPKPISSTDHIPVSFSVSSSCFKLFVGLYLKYIFWFSGQIFAASPRITAILLKCETNSNNLHFLIILQPFYTSFPSHCRKLAYLEYEHNFPNIANTIVNRVNWSWILVNIKTANKETMHDLGWKVHNHAHLLFFTNTLCMNYIIAMFLLVSCMNTCNLLYFARFCAQSTPKIENKNLQQRTLVGFISISLY